MFYTLQNISFQKQDSIIYADLVERFTPSHSLKAKLIEHRMSPLQQHSSGYKYVDIFKTIHKNNSYSEYISSMLRIFIINGIEHRIAVYTKGSPYNKTVCKSKRAICHEFEQLVNSFTVE
jgi:hypothetical protein